MSCSNKKNSIQFIKSTLKRLFPLHRSLTGNGNLETLKFISKEIKNFKIKKVKSNSAIYDWKVPDEWKIEDAYIKNKFNEKIIDYKKNNLHLVSYSIPFYGKINKKELMPHLHTLKNYPKWIPYRTTYYKKTWGFCCEHNLLKSKKFQGPFEVLIKSSFKKNGRLLYGEAFKKGTTDKEIIISTYCCHPSLANDNLSGLVLAIMLFKFIQEKKTKFSYRLSVAPETIGTLAFIKNLKNKKNIVGGTILTTVAGSEKISIKNSFDENSWINRLSKLVIEEFSKGNYINYPFTPDGSDERQFSSPGLRINTPSFHKSKYYEYKQYHTSADNLDFISASSLLESYDLYVKWFLHIENFCYPTRKNKIGEFQLGKRNLYPNIGGSINQKASSGNKYKELSIVSKKNLDAFRWIMHLANGQNSSIDISEKSKIELSVIDDSIEMLFKKKLIYK